MRLVWLFAFFIYLAFPFPGVAQTPPEDPNEVWTYKEMWAAPNPTWDAAVYG